MFGRPTSLLALVAAAASMSFAFSSSAHAATGLTGTEILQQFNLVTLGNANSNSHVDGRVFVGGNLTGGDMVQHASSTAASNYAGLTVLGNASNVKVNGLGAVIGGSLSNSTVNTGSSYISGNVSGSNLNGPAYVVGTKSGSNFNGGQPTTATALMQTNQAASTSTNFGTTLQAVSDKLKAAGANSTISISGNKATFNAVGNSAGVAVFNLDNAASAALFAAGEFTFSVSHATTIIINSSVTAATIGANFLGGQAQSLGSAIIWNFYNATSITTNAQFGGSILATHATLTNNQNIEGGVYVNGLQQNGEIHLQAFSGNISAVPEPQAYASMLGGLALLGFTAIRRRKKGQDRS